MDQLRTILASIKRNLGGLGATQKLLIGSGVVIMLMSLFLVSQYAGKSQMMSMGLGGDSDASQQVVSLLQASQWQEGRDYELMGNGDVRVRPEMKYQLAAEMAEGGSITSGTRLFFDNVFETQKFTMTKGQLEDSARYALQNELARTLSYFKAIDRATVNLSIPPVKGFGANTSKPTASVTVATVGGQTLAQSTVDAIARFVKGANSGLQLVNVEVINQSDGRAYKARDPEQQVAGDRLAYAKSIETDFTNKILSLYNGIKGLRVIVTADVDISRRRIDETRALPKGSGTEAIKIRETSRDTEDSTQAQGSEPGIRGNGAANPVYGSGGAGQKSTTGDEETEYQVIEGIRREQISDAGGDWTFLAATIGIPRGQAVAELKREQAADPNAAAAEPTAVEIQAWFDAFSAKMISELQGHIKMVGANGERTDGEVKTSLLLVDYTDSDDQVFGASSGGGGLLNFGSGGTGGMGSMVDNLVLGVLATVAMGMMFMMVRKAGKRVHMPTAEEIVGIPPALSPEDEVVGEADESETPLTGIEVDDTEVRNRKIMDQVNDLVTEDPDTAARLIKRWSTVDT